MPPIAQTLKHIAQLEIFKLIAGAGFFFACRVSGALLAYVTLIILARWTGATELGIFVFASSWCIALSTVACLGYPSAAYRFIGLGLAARDLGRIRGFVRRGSQIVIGSSLIMAGAGAAATLSIGGLISAEHVGPLLIAFLCVPIFAWVRLNTTVAHAFSWFALSTVPNSVLRPLLLLVAIGAVRLAGGALSAVNVMLLFTAVTLLVAIGEHALLARGLNRELRDAQPVYETRTWVRAGMPLLIIVLFTSYFPELSVILAGVYLPPEDIAKFNAGIRTASLIAFGLDAVDNTILPRISHLFARGDIINLQRIVVRSTQLKFWSALVAVLVLAVMGEHILALFGEEFVGGYGPLMIFALALLLRAAVGPATLLLHITGHQDRCIIIYACALVASLVLNFLLVPRFGMNGAAMAMLLVTGFWTVWLRIVVMRLISVQLSIFSFRAALRSDI
jgi:O-antigen/teichoic acid export membrane protein